MDDLPEYIVIYRNVKYPRLEYKKGVLTLILPKTINNPQQILQKYQEWIKSKQNIIKKALEEAESKALIRNRTEKELRELVNTLIKTYQEELKTTINGVLYRKMKTKWASYSHKKNITVNTLTKYLPQDLIEYIIYHEIVHSIERRHNEKFWNIITKKYPDYQNKERDLLTYWFIIQKTINTQKSED
ncbi:MAG: YgjP-like metallopeptidase domain-containing protein [Saccharolobus sp.]